jgi:DHA2 family multidrug resistance protein
MVGPWLGFAAMCVGLFMAILDVQIVGVALPRIARSLQTPLDELSWVQTAYLITESIGIAISGRLTRALSTRGLFVAATLGFAAASLGCGLATSFGALIVLRTIQGLFAGAITPTVFAAGYAMFSGSARARAILVAGAVAMLAPSIGPFIGGYVTQTATWGWIFFINVPLGIAVAAVVARRIAIDRPDPRAWRSVDLPAFGALALGLTALETLLKLGPEDHWRSARAFGLLALTLVSGWVFIVRCLRAREPLVDLGPLRDVAFAVACGLNFVVGAALFSSMYLLALFLGFVRFHTAFEIGVTMTVVGVAQLVAAPLASLVNGRLSTAWVAAFGFGLFAVGALSNAFQTPTTDFAGLWLPQIERGAALIFCLVPITQAALDLVPTAALANASGLLNLLRNIGGAVGIGIVDTVINLRPPDIARGLFEQLAHGSASAAAFVGIPKDLLAGVDPRTADPGDLAFIKPIVARAAATIAFNEAWLIVAGIVGCSLLLVPLLSRRSTLIEMRSPVERNSGDLSSVSSS